MFGYITQFHFDITLKIHILTSVRYLFNEGSHNTAGVLVIPSSACWTFVYFRSARFANDVSRYTAWDWNFSRNFVANRTF